MTDDAPQLAQVATFSEPPSTAEARHRRDAPALLAFEDGHGDGPPGLLAEPEQISAPLGMNVHSGPSRRAHRR